VDCLDAGGGDENREEDVLPMTVVGQVALLRKVGDVRMQAELVGRGLVVVGGPRFSVSAIQRQVQRAG
jgi:hypothetical protein